VSGGLCLGCRLPKSDTGRGGYGGGGNGGGGGCRRRRRPVVCDGRGNVGASAAVAHPAARSAGRDGNGHADGRSGLIELQALNHSIDGTDEELCFAVPIIAGDIHVIKDHINPLRILMRKHSLEGLYSSRDRGFVY
jgi:hypothetical protein